MHRLVALLLLSLYVPSALTATVTAHYCMGKLTGVNVMTSAPLGNTCSKCSMVKKDQKGCCHDKQETIKRVTDQLPAGTVNLPGISVYDISKITALFTESFSREYKLLLVQTHGPPLANLPPAFILHCVFRI